MITKRFRFGDYLLMTHLYRAHVLEIGALLSGKQDKWNGTRLSGQLIGLTWHFSFTLYSPVKYRIKAVTPRAAAERSGN